MTQGPTTAKWAKKSGNCGSPQPLMPRLATPNCKRCPRTRCSLSSGCPRGSQPPEQRRRPEADNQYAIDACIKLLDEAIGELAFAFLDAVKPADAEATPA